MYKTLSPSQVAEYVKLNKDVCILDKEDECVYSVGKLDYKSVIEYLNDETDRCYFWVVEEDETDEDT